MVTPTRPQEGPGSEAGDFDFSREDTDGLQVLIGRPFGPGGREPPNDEWDFSGEQDAPFLVPYLAR